MRSRHADRFNHDEDAPTYDTEVRDERAPVRAGYAEMLRWTAEGAGADAGSRVLELGSGTGNLSRYFLHCRELVCVDVSTAMTEVAGKKFGTARNIRYVHADLLEYFDLHAGEFDAVVSTYAVHHLTEPEKQHLLSSVYAHLKPGGRAVFGDLMVDDEYDRLRKIDRYRRIGDTETTEALEDEFFWMRRTARSHLEQLGFVVEEKAFSELSHGMRAVKPQ